MTSKEIQEMIIDLEEQIERFGGMSQFNYQLDILKSYKQDLERLEVLEKENEELKLWNEKYFSELKRWGYPEAPIHISEYAKLKKALEKACKILSWDCPCCQDLIDDLDCENRCQPDIDYAECWKKYFLKEVLGDV